MKAENNYDKLTKTDAETSPLPKEVNEVPTRAIDPELYDYTEDKAQVELEVELAKTGVPVIDVERPPVPDVKTDETRYKKVEVARKAEKSDGKEKIVQGKEDVDLTKDREMKAYVETLGIAKRKSILGIISKRLYDFYCKIHRFALNRSRKKYSKVSKRYVEASSLPQPLKKVALEKANGEDLRELGTERSFQRNGDKTSVV